MISLRIPQGVKRMFIVCVAVSFITGVLFFALNTWVTVEGDFGPEKYPWQFTTLKVHAASAFAMILFFGAFFGSHIPLAWRTKRSRNSGTSLAVFIGLQVITAYLLYYLADEFLRGLVVCAHISIGVGLPFLLTVHINVAKASKRAVVAAQ